MEASMTDLDLLPIVTLYRRLAVDIDQRRNWNLGRERSIRVWEGLQYFRFFLDSTLLTALEVCSHETYGPEILGNGFLQHSRAPIHIRLLRKIRPAMTHINRSLCRMDSAELH